MQARHKGRMFWARQAMVDGSEPQTREDFTAEHALRIWHQPFVLPGA